MSEPTPIEPEFEAAAPPAGGASPGAKSPQPIVPKSWQDGLGPYYVGLFLWIVAFDVIGRRALPVGGLGWSCLGAVVAGMLGYLLLFRVPATWGQATGKPIVELAGAAFGDRGARWVPGVLIGLAEILWLATAVYHGTTLSLRGLAEVGLVDPSVFRPTRWGSLRVEGPFFLAITLFWCVAAALAGRWLVRLIAAILYVFPIFPAMILGGVMLAELGGLRDFVPSGVDPRQLGTIPRGTEGIWAMLRVIQGMFGFFAMAGLMGADWGAASKTRRDVTVGGWVAAGVAPALIAVVALIAIAGHLGKSSGPSIGVDDLPGAPPVAIGGADPFADPIAARHRADLRRSSSTLVNVEPRELLEATFRAVLIDGIGGKTACGMLIIFGMAALAPGVFASHVLGRRLNEAIPRISRTAWTLLGIVVAWALMATGSVADLERIFTAMGAAFAPVAGCLAAEFGRSKGQWSGPRRGVNLAGLLGWATGATVGMLPLISDRFDRFQPAAFWAFLVAYAVYRVVAKVGGVAPPIAVVPLAPIGEGGAIAVTSTAR